LHPPHIYIINENQKLSNSLKMKFEEKNYIASSYSSVDFFQPNFIEDQLEAYIVDLGLLGNRGIEAIELIRKTNKLSPIFMISDTGLNNIEAGFNAGADDHVIKPFNLEQFYLKVARAVDKYNIIKKIMKGPRYQLLSQANTFIQGDLAIKLTKRETTILNKLIERKGQAVSRAELLTAFGDGEVKDIRNIDIHVFSLRKKISKTKVQIKSIRHVGYMFAEL